MHEIGRGAEAVIYQVDDKVIKERVKKPYRIAVLDNKLRAFRTKREAKVLERLQQLEFPAPRLIKVKDATIEMQFIAGQKLVEIFDSDPIRLAKEIGHKVAVLHKNNIIHGDLTTSNMILEEATRTIAFIDFGLSFFSEKTEDKAVDLHLLRQALESKHHLVYQEAYRHVLEAYQAAYPEGKAVIERLDIVEMRGRHKHKG